MFTISAKHRLYRSALKPVSREEKPACSWQLFPRWANASSQASQPLASYFKKEAGGLHQSWLLPERISCSLIFLLAWFISVFLLPFVCLFSTGLVKFAKLSEVGRRDSLFCTWAWCCSPIAFSIHYRGTCWICTRSKLLLQLIFHLCVAVPLSAVRDSMLIHWTKAWGRELTSSARCSWAHSGITSNRSAQGNELIPNAA